MSPAQVPTRSRLRLVGGDEPVDRDVPRDPRGNDRRTLDVGRENRLAAHAESSQRIDHQAIDPCDPRWVLAMQTQARLQGAVLTPEYRDQLLQSGRRLGLRAFESNLVIAVVQDKARRSQPLQLAQPTLSLVGEGIEHDSVGAAKPTARPTLAFARWFLVGASAALVAMTIIRWLTGSP